MPQAESDKYIKILAEAEILKNRDTIIDVDEQKLYLVIFQLAGLFFAFSGKDVEEIHLVGTIVFIPGVSHFFYGVINIRGEIESVLALSRLLGFPDSPSHSKNRIPILAKGELRTGILVDAVEDILDVPVSAIQPFIPAGGQIFQDIAIGQFSYKNKLVILLDTEKIFSKLGDKENE